MLDMLLGVFLPIAGFVAGYIYRDILLIKDLTRVSKELDVALSEKVKIKDPSHGGIVVKDFTKLRHEIIDGSNYFYLEKDSTFACQGNTLEEAAVNYAKANGSDNLGHFKHLTLNKDYCFVNNQCLEFVK